MNRELMDKAVAGSLKKDPPQVRVGDTVKVSTRIVEGEKERVQVFRGTVIGKRGKGIGATFTVRRIVSNEGVERTFPLHSPHLLGVEVVSSGRTRRAKLHYLRDRVGRRTRLTDIRDTAAGKARARAAKAALEEAEQAEAAPDDAQPAEG